MLVLMLVLVVVVSIITMAVVVVVCLMRIGGRKAFIAFFCNTRAAESAHTADAERALGYSSSSTARPRAQPAIVKIRRVDAFI
jgi:hypothetical protein